MGDSGCPWVTLMPLVHMLVLLQLEQVISPTPNPSKWLDIQQSLPKILLTFPRSFLGVL